MLLDQELLINIIIQIINVIPKLPFDPLYCAGKKYFLKILILIKSSVSPLQAADIAHMQIVSIQKKELLCIRNVGLNPIPLRFRAKTMPQMKGKQQGASN